VNDRSWMINCMIMMMNLMRATGLSNSFERQKDVLRSVGMPHHNLNDRKFREVVRREKLFYEQKGCCVDRSIPDTDRQTQIFVS